MAEMAAIACEAGAGGYVIVRTLNAGVFAGTLASAEGESVVLSDARRLWRWEGAASLSGLATYGTSRPTGCKFPAPVTRVRLFGVIEIISVTERARANIVAVSEWK